MELKRFHSRGPSADLLRTEQIREIFGLIDKNKDGQVNRQELRDALEMQDIQVPDHVRDVLFDNGDTDGDGMITFDEFNKLVNDPSFRFFFQQFFNIPPISEVKGQVKKYWQASTWWPPQIINFVVILVQIILFAVQTDDIKSKLEFQPSNKEEAWRYYTYSLMHLTWTHVISNSVFQLLFGSALEPVHGWRVALIYVIGVFAGSLLHAVTNNASSLIGASAGASALILAWASDVFLNFSEQSCPVVSLLPVAIFIVWQILMTPGTTSVAAHISGGITGFLFGFIVLRNIRKLQFEGRITKIALVLGIIYIVVLIVFNIFNVHT